MRIPSPGDPVPIPAHRDREVVHVRIGFDMFAVQSPHHGHRGIGRYSRELVRSILALGAGHEYVLYVHEDLPTDRVAASPHAEVRRILGEEASGGMPLPARLDELSRRNPDGLDALVVLSPFERWGHYAPPPRRRGGPRTAAVVYDMIPFLWPPERRSDPAAL